MKKLVYILLAVMLLMSVSACGGTSSPAQTSLPSSEPSAQSSSEPTSEAQSEITLVTAAPDGQEFQDAIDLSLYDNPNFDVELKNGKATVTISFVELWTDYADPNSTEQSEKDEAARREEITEAISSPRVIAAGDDVTAVYELPCTTWFPGSDANAIIGTADGHWYYVDLTGEDNGGEPELTELVSIRGETDVAFQWRTTSHDEKDGVSYTGEDYVIAVNASGSESIVWPEV